LYSFIKAIPGLSRLIQASYVFVLDNEYNYFGFKSKERKITGKGRQVNRTKAR
jgi:hypothetical protein